MCLPWVIHASPFLDMPVSRIFMCLVAGVIFIAQLVRLYGLDQIGVGGSDTILYYTLAEAWLKGDLVFQIGDSIEIFRPVLLAFNGLSLWLFGHTDHAIKVANSLVDGLNMMLVAALAWGVSKRQTVVMASVATYGFLPIAIWSARQELPHTLSTFFTLLSCLFVLNSIPAKRAGHTVILSAIGGLALMGATLVHEELIFIALPLALTLVLGIWLVPGGSIKSGLAALAAFCISPIAASLLVMTHEGVRVASTIDAVSGDFWTIASLYPERASRYIWNGIVGTSSSIFAISCLISAMYYLLGLRSGRGDDTAYTVGCGMCLGVPFLFIALYALFFGTIFPRGVLPVVPLLIIAIFFSLDRLIVRKSPTLQASACAVLVLAFSVSSLASFTAFKVGNRKFGREWASADWPTVQLLKRGYGEFLVDARYVPSYATHWRNIHEALGDRVTDDRRLLVVPSTVFYAAGRRALQTSVYLGDKAVYRLDHYDQPLATIIREKNIGYILFTVGQSRGVPSRHRPYRYSGKWGEPRPVDLAGAYGMDAYSAQSEYGQVAGLMQAMGARPLSLFPPDSFESRVARVWQLP
jgi:hypothetical protein